MSTNTTQSDTQAPTQHKAVLGAFGDGRYSPAMAELYRDSQRLLGFTKLEAHVTAVRLGIDAGQLSSAQVKLSYGKKTDKNGARTLKEITNSVKVINTWAMSIGAVCAMLDDARKNGLVVVEATMDDDIMKFVHDAASRVEVIEKA